MRKIKYIIFVVLVLLSINVVADDRCETSELTRLKELAKKVEFDYDYKLVNDAAVFSINAVNLNKELKVMIIEDYYLNKYKEFKDNSTHMAKLENFKPGEKVTVTINAFVPNRCSGKTLLTKTIKLPYYNYYYNEEICSGNEDFKYCKLLVDNSITESEFYNQLNQFKIARDGNVEENNESKSGINKELIIIIAGSVLAVIVIAMIINKIIKTKKKNEL